LHNRSVALIASVLALGLLVAGCGGSDNGGESSGNTAASGSDAASTEGGEAGTIGKAAFLKRGNAICLAAKKKIEAQVTAALSNGASAKSSGEARLNEIVSTIIADRLQARLDAIRALGLPNGAEAEAGAALDLMQEQVEEAKTDPHSFAEAKESKRTENEPVKKLGLTVCPLAWL
jgi:hypothetical protein